MPSLAREDIAPEAVTGIAWGVALAVNPNMTTMSVAAAKIAPSAIRSTRRIFLLFPFIAGFLKFKHVSGRVLPMNIHGHDIGLQSRQRMRQANVIGMTVLFRLFHAARRALTPFPVDLSLGSDRFGSQ